MTLSIDYFFSFRSPYSYLSVPRIVALRDQYDLDVKLRVVLPLAVRDPTFFTRANPLWVGYLLRDVFRLAEFHGMKIGGPRPDPIVMDYAARKAAEEQPYIHRISRLGVLAEEHGAGLAFVHEASQLIWNGEVEGWHEGEHLSAAAERAGLSLDAMEAQAAAETARIDSIIADNQAALERAGHWGVPTFVFEDEPFFGQDRIELLTWRLRQQGLQPRS